MPTPHFIVNSAWVNVRTGPGNNYPIIDAVPRGERFDIIARNRAGSLRATWIEFCCVNDQRGWIYAGLVRLSVDWAAIPISTNIPALPTATNTPVPPTATRTPVPPTRTPVPPTSPPSNGNGLGLPIEPENRCTHYDSDDYPYPQSVEPHIVNQQGGRIYGPYTGRYFASIRETDIEHIVARSEAHDSGLCARDSATKRAFARDLLNLTLASPSVNRHQKVDKDLAQWLPALNQCWYVNQVVLVKRKYNLSMDRAEAAVARRVLAACPRPIVMLFTDPGSAPPPPNTPTPLPPPASGGNCDSNPLACYDDNNNGRITCAEARRHGIAPVPRGHPAYQYMRDGDNDGVVCE
ncbi:MAG: excalibur calcium-binding domain-containing protein [Caldilineaceae bacterium]|nr:excalibur calcium-binding domain-containing protein [Caldilineaceae bacterium]